MAKLRQPRDLERYDTADDVASQLERIAASLRRRGGLAKFSLKLSLWDPLWLATEAPKTEVIVTGMGLGNAKSRAGR